MLFVCMSERLVYNNNIRTDIFKMFPSFKTSYKKANNKNIRYFSQNVANRFLKPAATYYVV